MPIPLLSILDIGTKLIDRLVPDKSEQAKMKLELLKLEQEGDLTVMAGQMKINEVEAASGNVFVSGWRPACGWICVIGLGNQFVLGPILTWFSDLFGYPVPFPTMDMTYLSTMLLGLLGLSGMRTYEKVQGVNK